MVINVAVSAANSTPACPPLAPAITQLLITSLTALHAYSMVFVVIGARIIACSVLSVIAAVGRPSSWMHIRTLAYSHIRICQCANMRMCEYANMRLLHIRRVRVITQKTSFAGERRLSPAKDGERRVARGRR